jgi:hypothetical protein
MVAARRYKTQPKLFQSLIRDYKKLLWSTISEFPQPYHTVKALCLICLWPIPVIHSYTDPTYHLSGTMIQLAVQSVLHLPIKTDLPPQREFSTLEKNDRLATWMACNIVAEKYS